MKVWYSLLLALVILIGINACGSNETPPLPTEYRVITSEPVVQELQATINAYETLTSNLALPPSSTPHVIAQGVIINGTAVLFDAPAMDAAEIGTLPVNTQVNILATTEPNRIGVAFYNVQYETLSGWVANTQVQLQAEPPTTSVALAVTSVPLTPTDTLRPFASSTPSITPSPTRTPTALPPGFPTPEVYSLVLAEQIFEHGRMLWFQPLRQIWVLTGDAVDPLSGTWACYLDEFVEGEPERDPALEPPPNLSTTSRVEGAIPMQPIRGFGKIWRTVPNLRETLGWALTPETLYTTRYEYTAGGTLANGRYTPAPGEYRLESLYQYTLVLTEDTVRAPCENKTGQWRIE